ncbi:MAG: hypothetical protein KGO52_14810, partial [Nitrospirota bacterium]|nr:hypothetical protein [Nitrospirota bacterium]
MAMIDEAGRTALKHYLTSCTVVITSETPEFEHGTGGVVRYKNQTYILTAAHVLEGEPSDEKLLITGRPDSALVEVPQHELPGAFLAGTHGPIKLSRGTRIPISKRLAGKGLKDKDIAALKVQDVEKHLPHTASHYLPGHGPIDTSEGKPVNVCGFPGKLAIHASHRATGQSIA